MSNYLIYAWIFPAIIYLVLLLYGILNIHLNKTANMIFYVILTGIACIPFISWLSILALILMYIIVISYDTETCRYLKGTKLNKFLFNKHF